MLHAAGVDQLLEVSAGLRREVVRERMILVDLQPPDASQTRTAQVEVHQQCPLSSLGARNSQRAGRDCLALAGLGGHQQKHLGDRLVAWRIEQVAETRHCFREL